MLPGMRREHDRTGSEVWSKECGAVVAPLPTIPFHDSCVTWGKLQRPGTEDLQSAQTTIHASQIEMGRPGCENLHATFCMSFKLSTT